MSFKEKLQKLRKESKYSQEELADMLDVTRQSVSKWESGQTYPEMDKLLAICKIFNCSLDELTNDEIKELSSERKNNFNSLVDSSLDFIKKTYNMLTSMKPLKLLQCFLTMLIVGFILAFFYIPVHILQEAFSSIVFATGNTAGANFISTLFNVILGCAFIAFYIMIFIYIFKIGFLDKYEFVQNKVIPKVTQEEKKEVIESKTEVIYTPKEDKDYQIFKTLGMIVMFFIKIFLLFFALPFLGMLFLLFAALVINIYLIIQGVFFFSILLFIIFGAIGVILVLEFIANIIFNRQHSYRRMLITLFIGVAGLGMASGVMFLELSSFEYHDEIPPGVEYTTQVFEIPFSDDMLLHLNHMIYRYEIDESLTDKVILEVKYFEDFNQITTYNFGVHHHVFDRGTNFNQFRRTLDLIVESLKNREIYNHGLLFRSNIVIRTSSANMETIKQNMEEHRQYEMARQTEIESYLFTIHYLENQIWQLEIEGEQNNHEKEMLRFQIQQLQNEINELRNHLQSILN